MDLRPSSFKLASSRREAACQQAAAPGSVLRYSSNGAVDSSTLTSESPPLAGHKDNTKPWESGAGNQAVLSWTRKKRLRALFGLRGSSPKALEPSEAPCVALPKSMLVAQATEKGMDKNLSITYLSEQKRHLAIPIAEEHDGDRCHLAQRSTLPPISGEAVTVTTSSGKFAPPFRDDRPVRASTTSVDQYWIERRHPAERKPQGRLFISEDDPIPAQDTSRKYLTPARAMLHHTPYTEALNNGVVRPVYDCMSDDEVRLRVRPAPAYKAKAHPNLRVVTKTDNQPRRVGESSSSQALQVSKDGASAQAELNNGVRPTPASHRTASKKKKTRNKNINRSGAAFPPPLPGPAPMRPLPSLPVEARKTMTSKREETTSVSQDDRLQRGGAEESNGLYMAMQHRSWQENQGESSVPWSSTTEMSSVQVGAWQLTLEELQKQRKSREEWVRMRKRRDTEAMRTSLDVAVAAAATERNCLLSSIESRDERLGLPAEETSTTMVLRSSRSGSMVKVTNGTEASNIGEDGWTYSECADHDGEANTATSPSPAVLSSALSSSPSSSAPAEIMRQQPPCKISEVVIPDEESSSSSSLPSSSKSNNKSPSSLITMATSSSFSQASSSSPTLPCACHEIFAAKITAMKQKNLALERVVERLLTRVAEGGGGGGEGIPGQGKGDRVGDSRQGEVGVEVDGQEQGQGIKDAEAEA